MPVKDIELAVGQGFLVRTKVHDISKHNEPKINAQSTKYLIVKSYNELEYDRQVQEMSGRINHKSSVVESWVISDC